MTVFEWAGLLASSVVAGALLVPATTLPQRRVAAVVVPTLMFAVASVAALVVLSLLVHRSDEAILGGVLGLGAFFGGFALGAALLAQTSPDAPPAELPDAPPDGPIGVVLLTSAEPAEYDASAVTAELRLLDEAGVPLPPETARVFIYASERSRYHRAGGSPARATAYGLARRLATALGPDGRFGTPHLAFCAGGRLLDGAIADAVADGAPRVVVVQLTVADNVEFERAKRRVDVLRPGEHGVGVAYTEPLWGATSLAERIAERIAEAVGDAPPDGVGVALLGGGQPPEYGASHSSVTERETYFQQRVRALLIDRGFDEQRVRLGWLEWQDPGPTEVVRHLEAVGCRLIVVVPACTVLDSLATMIDLRDSVRGSRLGPGTATVLLPAWGDDPVVADVLAASVRETAEDPGE